MWKIPPTLFTVASKRRGRNRILFATCKAEIMTGEGEEEEEVRFPSRCGVMAPGCHVHSWLEGPLVSGPGRVNLGPSSLPWVPSMKNSLDGDGTYLRGFFQDSSSSCCFVIAPLISKPLHRSPCAHVRTRVFD